MLAMVAVVLDVEMKVGCGHVSTSPRVILVVVLLAQVLIFQQQWYWEVNVGCGHVSTSPRVIVVVVVLLTNAEVPTAVVLGVGCWMWTREY